MRIEVLENNGIPLCGEIILTKSLGYGKYYFFLTSRIDQLISNLVLGLFTWSESTAQPNCEIDIEFSRWNNETSTNSQYVVQPCEDIDRLFRFNTNLSGTHSTHIIDWKPDEINFQSFNGHYLAPPTSQHIIKSWTYKGNAIPKPDNENIHINLWKYGNQPLRISTDQLSYITMSDFTFHPH